MKKESTWFTHVVYIESLICSLEERWKKKKNTNGLFNVYVPLTTNCKQVQFSQSVLEKCGTLHEPTEKKFIILNLWQI